MVRITNNIRIFIKNIASLEINLLLISFLDQRLNLFLFVLIDIINQFILIKLIFFRLIKK